MTSTDTPAVANDDRPSGLIQALIAILCLLGLAFPYLAAPAEREGDSIGNELVFDGRQLMTQHEVLSAVPESPGMLLDTLTTPWWGRLFPEQQLYRPLSSFALGLGGVISGERYDPAEPGMSAIPYKLIAVALKIVCALLVLEVATILLGSSRRGAIAGLLFATLPVHGEAVFDVAGTAELLAGAFSLASWWAWLKAGDRPLSNPVPLLTSMVFLFFAINAKESAYALPLVFFLVDLGRAGSGGIGDGFKHALSKLPAYAGLAVVLALGLALRWMVLGSLLPGGGAIESIDNALVDAGPLERISNAIRILASSVPIVLGLNPLSSNHLFTADYSFRQIEVLSPFAVANLIGIAALIGMKLVALVFFPKCRTRASLVWAYFGSLLIVSNIFFPIGTIFAERLLFFPSALLVMFIAPFLAGLGRAGLVVATVIALANGYWTHVRAGHWSTEEDLWDYTADESSTESARAKFNNGVALTTSQLYSLAVKEFERALELDDDFDRARYALADVHGRSFDYEKAVVPLVELVERMAERDGWTYVRGDDAKDAEYTSLLNRITTIEAKSPGDNPERNLAFLDSLLARGLDRPEVQVYRFETLRSLGREDDAEQALKSALETEPSVLVVDTYAKYLQRQGREQEAQAVRESWLASLDETQSPAAAAQIKLDTGRSLLAVEPGRSLTLASEVIDSTEAIPAQLRNEARILRAQARIDQGSVDDGVALGEAVRASIDDYQVAIASASARPELTYAATYGLSTLLLQQGRFEEAEPYLMTAVSYAPKPVFYHDLGRSRRLAGRADEALDVLREGVESLTFEDGSIQPFLYRPMRLEQISALASSSLPERDERIDAILDAERERGDEFGATIRAVALIRLQRWAEARQAINELRSLATDNGSMLADLLSQYLDASDALRLASTDLLALDTVANLACRPIDISERVSGVLTMIDGAVGLNANARAIDLTPTTDISALAFRRAQRATILESLGRPTEALAEIEDVKQLDLQSLPPQATEAIDAIEARLRALLGS
ncbi:MAG: tetratricopeptide repeat protein [Planctomycetota bacterium]|jgi:tetratricopeptide (TPR) repeat protein